MATAEVNASGSFTSSNVSPEIELILHRANLPDDPMCAIVMLTLTTRG